ncbi:MAG: tyrosine-type recombinase/integrase [Gemmatimonadaceae bacterium]|nr:tyrosine-type recombinase/integrase [Gemmatimonadaceae bacterium]
MLKSSFNKPTTLRRLPCGVAEPFLGGLATALSAQGYSSETRDRYACAAGHLGEWAARRDLAITDLDEAVLARFVRHLPGCRCRARHRGYKRVPFWVHRFLHYLREAGVVAAAAPGPARSALVTEYSAWMRDRRGLAASTISHALPMAEALLGSVDGDPTGLDAACVRRFVLEHIRQHAPASAGCVTSTVRCFLRYLVVQGRCSTDLVEAVPKVPTWRLAKLPRYLPVDDVERLIAACDRKSIVALRDRAMLLLLARLGLRASDVVGLRLGDIDWVQGRLRVAGKGRRETRLPLPQDAGDAILGYLKEERSAAATDRVFLTSRTPIRPLTTSGLRDVVWRVIERAGVSAPSRGTHILRHSLATRLLREGATLDSIGALLRHRDVNTTALYSKVDVGLLRQVAQPWPGAEVSPC